MDTHYQSRIEELATKIPGYKELCEQDKVFGRVYEIARMFFKNDLGRDVLINIACEAVGAYGYLASTASRYESIATVSEITVKDLKNTGKADFMAEFDTRVTEAREAMNARYKDEDIDVELKKHLARQYKTCAELAEKIVSVTQSMIKALNSEQMLEGRKIQ